MHSCTMPEVQDSKVNLLASNLKEKERIDTKNFATLKLAFFWLVEICFIISNGAHIMKLASQNTCSLQ